MVISDWQRRQKAIKNIPFQFISQRIFISTVLSSFFKTNHDKYILGQLPSEISLLCLRWKIRSDIFDQYWFALEKRFSLEAHPWVTFLIKIFVQSFFIIFRSLKCMTVCNSIVTRKTSFSLREPVETYLQYV